jgi:hypothetical protein
VVHIAGAALAVPPYVRQRCAWCGACLVHRRLDPQQEAAEVVWPEGAFVSVVPQGAALLPPPAGRPGALPPGACAGLDPEATR